MINSSSLSLFATGKTTGVIVQCGECRTYTVPIYEGFPLYHALNKARVGGRDITDIFRKGVEESKIAIRGGDIHTLRQIKEKIDKITQEKNEEINKIKNEKDEINNKLNKKDKEIITLITNSTKEKKNLLEQSNNEMEQLKKEINDLKDINEAYKDQVNSLQKKFFEIENINNDKIKNISIKKEIELNYIFINPKEEKNKNNLKKMKIMRKGKQKLIKIHIINMKKFSWFIMNKSKMRKINI